MNEKKDFAQEVVESYYEACRQLAAKYENISEPSARTKYAVARSIMRSIDMFPYFWTWDNKYDNTLSIILAVECLGYFIMGVAPELSQYMLNALDELKEVYSLIREQEG
jgi:hypothetical protein